MLFRSGYTGWFLPARDELAVMYSNKDAIGGFSSGSYWSSTESTESWGNSQGWPADIHAVSRNFIQPADYVDRKEGMLIVRPVRYF